MSVQNFIPDVLAQRYASEAMRAIWSPEGRILLEREFWIAVMKAQKDLGIQIPDEAIQAYESVIHNINLNSIQVRERVLRHDVKARIEEFCELAGHQHIHKGMTSRDLTDNVEQLQIVRSLKLIHLKYLASLNKLASWADCFKDQMMVARTHNVPAQPTTFGKRLAMFGQEMLESLRGLHQLLEAYPLRGLQGAVGTQLDQWVLFDHDESRVQQMAERVRTHLGVAKTLNAVGQVYPRSLDFEVASCLFQCGSGIASLAKTLRLMAGHDLITEGFSKQQVGSSAMPHKMNMRSTERLSGFQHVLQGFLSMISGLTGDQWNEGDVACSVVRRVALPGVMFTMDGMLETLLNVLNDMHLFEHTVQAELNRNLPFLATTSILMAAVQKGTGRETAHEVIKAHAVAVVNQLRDNPLAENDLPQRLANEPKLPLTLEEIQAIMNNAQQFMGSARNQTQSFVKEVESLMQQFPEARRFEPSPIL